MSYKLTCAISSFSNICSFFYNNIYILLDFFISHRIFYLFIIVKLFHTTNVHLLTLGLLPIRLS